MFKILCFELDILLIRIIRMSYGCQCPIRIKYGYVTKMECTNFVSQYTRLWRD